MTTTKEIIEVYEDIMRVYRKCYPLPKYGMVTASTKDAQISYIHTHTTADSIYVGVSSTTADYRVLNSDWKLGRIE